MTINMKDFEKMELRVGEIISVENVSNADKLYVLQVDIGGKQIQLIAGIKKNYKPEKLKGKKIVVVTNLEPATIRGIRSDGMLLAAVDNDNISLITVDKDVPPGTPVA
jgi:methionyl-tRNA synthetase